jgi:hypothetical protein
MCARRGIPGAAHRDLVDCTEAVIEATLETINTNT